MKKLIVFLLLTLILACSAQRPRNFADDSRPYLHWKIHYVKVSPSETSPDYSVLIETLELTDAIEEFRKTCDNCEIRAVARDYYYLCQTR